jgi:hypothetical protein
VRSFAAFAVRPGAALPDFAEGSIAPFNIVTEAEQTGTGIGNLESV